MDPGDAGESHVLRLWPIVWGEKNRGLSFPAFAWYQLHKPSFHPQLTVDKHRHRHRHSDTQTQPDISCTIPLSPSTIHSWQTQTLWCQKMTKREKGGEKEYFRNWYKILVRKWKQETYVGWEKETKSLTEHQSKRYHLRASLVWKINLLRPKTSFTKPKPMSAMAAMWALYVWYLPKWPISSSWQWPVGATDPFTKQLANISLAPLHFSHFFSQNQ